MNIDVLQTKLICIDVVYQGLDKAHSKQVLDRNANETARNEIKHNLMQYGYKDAHSYNE